MGGLFGGSKKSNKPPPKPVGPQGYSPPESRKRVTDDETTVPAAQGSTEAQARRKRRLVALGG